MRTTFKGLGIGEAVRFVVENAQVGERPRQVGPVGGGRGGGGWRASLNTRCWFALTVSKIENEMRFRGCQLRRPRCAVGIRDVDHNRIGWRLNEVAFGSGELRVDLFDERFDLLERERCRASGMADKGHNPKPLSRTLGPPWAPYTANPNGCEQRTALLVIEDKRECLPRHLIGKVAAADGERSCPAGDDTNFLNRSL
jgi:hypothetical protein